MLAELLGIVAPVYVCASLGFGWVRLGRRYDTQLVTELITQVGAPCLVFSSLVGLPVSPDALLQMVGATLLALACFALLGALALRLAGLPATVFLGPVTFANTGNMGLPLCLFAFGEPGLALGVAVFATVAITHFTVGQWIWSGRVSASQLLRTPLAWAGVAAAGVLSTGALVPGWILDTTRMLGGFTIPLMQFTLGVSLGQLGLGKIPRGLFISVLRIGMGAGVGAILAGLIGLEGVSRAVFVLDCSMPVAVFNYLMAEQYDRQPADVAGLVVLSTLVSFATVPLVLAWVL